MLRMEPPPCAEICGAKARTTDSVPRKWVSSSVRILSVSPESRICAPVAEPAVGAGDERGGLADFHACSLSRSAEFVFPTYIAESVKTTQRYSGLMTPEAPCSIERSLGVVGPRWTLLILREALSGATRFAEFRDALGIAPDVLTERLATLTQAGGLV